MNLETTMNDIAHNNFPKALARGRRWDHFELLERIDASGSISSAASAMGMSYKAAWQAVEAMNNLSELPVVERQTGGKHGGGTRLTTYGRRLVVAYRGLEKEREKVLAALGKIMDDFEQYYQLIRRFDMKTSARNQFLGKVINVKHGPISAEVTLDIGGGDVLTAVITNDSAEQLALQPGAEACGRRRPDADRNPLCARPRRPRRRHRRLVQPGRQAL